MRFFLSTYTNKVDRKGRVSVPAQFRALLSAKEFAGFAAYPSFTSPCIECCDMDFLERLLEGTQTFDAFSPEQDTLSNVIFPETQVLTWDAEGRIVLPKEMMDHANISENATFVGLGQKFQIWEPEARKVVKSEFQAKAMRDRPTMRLPPAPGSKQ
jgi:MraZ protein